jgi:hypothetical protein
VIVGSKERYLGLFGIETKVGGQIELYGGINYRYNRYLKYQYKRLLKLLGATVKGSVQYNHDWMKGINRANQKKISIGVNSIKQQRKYWTIAFQLLTRSSIFKTAPLAKLMGKGENKFHASMHAKELQQLLLDYDLTFKVLFSQKCKTWRVWIESPPGKYRPLGVSSLTWRIYLKGLTIFLENQLRGSWDPEQHAYMSGRGTFSCWKDIIKKVLDARDIYEYDFKGFFNSVCLDVVGQNLRKIGLPKYVIGHILNIAGCEIKAPKISKVKDLESKAGIELFKKYEYIYEYRKDFR